MDSNDEINCCGYFPNYWINVLWLGIVDTDDEIYCCVVIFLTTPLVGRLLKLFQAIRGPIHVCCLVCSLAM